MYENGFSTGATSRLIEGLLSVGRRIVVWTVCWTVFNVRTKLCTEKL